MAAILQFPEKADEFVLVVANYYSKPHTRQCSPVVEFEPVRCPGASPGVAVTWYAGPPGAHAGGRELGARRPVAFAVLRVVDRRTHQHQQKTHPPAADSNTWLQNKLH